MKTTHHAWRVRCWAAGALVLIVVGAAPARAGGYLTQDDAADGGARTTADRAWTYDTRGPNQSAAEKPGTQWWETGPWFMVVSAGPAWFDGDDMANSVTFAGQVRVGRELSRSAYLFGSYLFALPETHITGPGGNSDFDSHDLHAVTFGGGVQAVLSPEFRLYLEPHLGVLFGSDIDAAPVGALTGGFALYATDYVAMRFEVTGLVTDATIDTSAGDAEIDTGVIVSFGVLFEF
jgi:hypothetical protein